jgi:hypothetical protein
VLLPSLRSVAVLEALPSEVALPVAAVASLPVVALPAATSAVALTTSLATAKLRP